MEQSLSSPPVFDELSKADRNRVQSAYDNGKGKVEYLQLEFIEFNQKYFDALIKLKEEDQSVHDAKPGDKRKRDENSRSGATKRTRK